MRPAKVRGNANHQTLRGNVATQFQFAVQAAVRKGGAKGLR